nr:uncharacterized protein LOC117224868 [Megalopta genalis]
MDDANLLVKELRIDWETLLTENFNPLKQSLENKKSNYKQSNYRNTYHKVQKVIDKIIEISYKGFSDSVISYMESYNYTVKCLENIYIDNINTTLDILTNISVNDKELSENYESTAYFRRKNEICGILANIVGLYEKYLEHVTNKMYIEACSFARDIFDSIKSNELDIITGVKYFLNDELSESVRLKDQGKENMLTFVDKLMLLDEVLSELCSHGSLNNAIKFFEKRVDDIDLQKQ